MSGVFGSGVFDEDDNPFARTQERPVPRGHGYELSYMYHKHKELHRKPYFPTSQLGTPFPSYHTNPLPAFPARWTRIPGVRPPIESLTAPRVRLGPQELQERHATLGDIRKHGAGERTEEQPVAAMLNLCSQALGDTYQMPGFLAFMALHKTVVVLNLGDNELEDLSELELPCCKKLHLSKNNIVTFHALPQLPVCEALYLHDNFISSADGLHADKFPKLKSITLRKNPLEHRDDYPAFVWKRLETLDNVDGQPKTMPRQLVRDPDDGSWILLTELRKRQEEKRKRDAGEKDVLEDS